MLLMLSADFFSKLTFSKKSSWKTIRVPNCLDPNQDWHFVGPDLGANCLHKSPAERKKLEIYFEPVL